MDVPSGQRRLRRLVFLEEAAQRGAVHSPVRAGRLHRQLVQIAVAAPNLDPHSVPVLARHLLAEQVQVGRGAPDRVRVPPSMDAPLCEFFLKFEVVALEPAPVPLGGRRVAETLRVGVEAAPMVAELVHDLVPGLPVVVEDSEQVAPEEAAARDRDRAIRRLVAGLQIDRDDLRFLVARLRLLDIPANLVAVLTAVDLVLDDEEDLPVLRRDVDADIHALLLGSDFDARHLFGCPVLPRGMARDDRTDKRSTERVHPGVRGGGVPVPRVRPSQDVGEGGVLRQFLRGERVEVGRGGVVGHRE